MKCIFCNEELKTPCEQLYGICKDDAPKAKQILSMAMSVGLSMKGNDK